MFRKFFLAVLGLFPWLLLPDTEMPPSAGDGDNRGSLDPNG